MKEENTNLIMLSIYDHHLIKNNFFLLINRVAESYNMQIIKNNEKPTSQSYYNSFFSTTNLGWRKIYLLPHKTNINAKLRFFQCKVLNNMLCLNKMHKSSERNICSAVVHFRRIFGHKLKYSFRIILLSLISCHGVPFLVLWKKFKIKII